MNEQLSQALSGILHSLQQTKDFAISQIPDVVYQMMLWHGFRSIIAFILGIAIFILSIKATKYAIKGFQNINDDGDVPLPLAAAILGFSGIVVSCNLLSNITWIEILIAPNYYGLVNVIKQCKCSLDNFAPCCDISENC